MRSCWRLKACPRCGGDTHLENHPRDGWQEECLQCGYSIDRNEKATVQEMAERLFKEVKV